MHDALTEVIQRRFRLVLHDASPIEQGDEALVWRVETDQGARIVHIGPAWRSSEELAWTHRVIRHAAAGAPQAIPPLPAPDGATFFRHDGRPVTLFEFIDGDPLDTGDAALVDHSARVLACIHSSLADWPGGPRPPGGPDGPDVWDPADDPCELVDHELDRWWAAASSALRTAVVHGDYYPRNLLCREGRLVAVVDWYEAAVSLMRVWLRENVRYGLALARPGRPADEHHLGLQLRAFVELGRLAA
ncbi:MAG: phosphotransferase [Solirubrobacteraceae bacterium MAG38_C4-C5]|nr:phosphotransferase [Candidatus Siliceabacter maunaloa]